MILVYRLTANVVAVPVEDGADVENVDLGYYSRPQTAIEWILDEGEGHFDSPEEHLLLYYLTEYKLDVGPVSGFRSLSGLSPSGQVVGRTLNGDLEKPWEGRDPATCKWKRGDVVACEIYGKYRIGIVEAQPLPPECPLKKTQIDDVYLVLFGEKDHEHPREWEMFEPLNPVPDELREKLQRRLEVEGDFEARCTRGHGVSH